MSRQLLAFIVLSLSSPAVAGEPYVGIEVGSGRVRPSDVDETVEYRSTPAMPGDPTLVFTDDVFSARWDRTLDVAVVAGYDFGWFRMEGELAHKRAPIDHIADDDAAEQFLSELNANLNRPSQAPDPGAPGLPALTLDDFQQLGALKVRSAMVNGIIDVKLMDRLNVYAGVGVGWSFLQGFDDHDSTGAWQRMLGARYSLSERIGLGVKYRNFRTGVIKLVHDPVDHDGNPSQVAPTTDAAVISDIEGQFRTKSLLMSLMYNFR
jgi:opacity protein-like surface antigen